MKIAMFTNTYLPHVGGVARSVHQFSEDYRRMGHDVLVVAPTFENAEESTEGVLRVPAIRNFNGSDFSVRIPTIGLVSDEMIAFQPDIIHSHHPFLLGDTALRESRQSNTPIVFTHHTLYEQYTHYVGSDSGTMHNLAIELATSYANLCNHIFAPSESVAKLLRERGVTTPVTELPTGVDLDVWAGGKGSDFRSEHKIPEDAFVIGHLGRLAKEKNLDYLSVAVQQYMKNDENAWFLLAGTGNMEEELREFFSKAGLSSRVCMPGNLGGDDLANAYSAMDLFVFASQSETQGMVLTEAMASSTPVLALDASGVREVLKDGENGFMLPSTATEREFRMAIEKARDALKNNPHHAEAALATAKTFSREETAKSALNVYSELMEKSRETHAQITDSWDRLLNRIDVEWDLLASKAEAAINAFTKEDKES